MFVLVAVACCHLVLLSVSICQATHFRGAQFWFRSVVPVPNQAEVNFQLTWNRLFRSDVLCDSDVIASGRPTGPPTPGYVICDVGCEKQGRVSDVSIRCIDYSALENWMTGVGAHNITFQGNGTYILAWEGQGWFKYDVPWQFRLLMNLNLRPSTGRVNSSPRAILPTRPFEMQQGCNANIRLTVVDDDGDVVRCRWASSSRQECGGVCHDSFGSGQPVATLDQATCAIQLSPYTIPNDYILAVQIEDFDPSDALFASPLSSVPVQFPISMYNSTISNDSSSNSSSPAPPASGTAAPPALPAAYWCQLAPVFVPPTPENGSCVRMMEPSRNHSVVIAARTKDDVTRVSKIRLLSSDRVNVSDVAQNGSDFYVIMTLTPADVKYTDTTFCFEATDNFGVTSNRTCFIISFGLNPPTAISATFDATYRRILITFNQKVTRPSIGRLVSVYDTNGGQLVTSYDTSSATQVTFNGDVIAMTPTAQLLNPTGRCFFIALQPGAVVSDQCSIPSAEFANKTSLNFTTTSDGPKDCGYLFPANSTTHAPYETTTGGSSVTSTSSWGNVTTKYPWTDAASSTGDNGSWNYRWLIVAVVVAVVVFIIVALTTALVIRRSRSRENDRRERQERFFETLNSRGVYNWTYEGTGGTHGGPTTSQVTTGQAEKASAATAAPS